MPFDRRLWAEDIHSFVWAWLVGELGELGRKLHAGRSRIPQLEDCLQATMAAVAELALREHATAMPGYTHLQSAQIITAGHHALACANSCGGHPPGS